jgi:hypothetical protein
MPRHLYTWVCVPLYSILHCHEYFHVLFNVDWLQCLLYNVWILYIVGGGGVSVRPIDSSPNALNTFRLNWVLGDRHKQLWGMVLVMWLDLCLCPSRVEVKILLLLPLVPQPSLGLGLLHKIRLNFLEASQQFSFLQPHAQPPSRRTRPLYLYPPEAGWLPVLVASYDTHGLRWVYSYSPVTTRGGGKNCLKLSIPPLLPFFMV